MVRQSEAGVTRRQFLFGAGAITVLGAGGVGWRAWDQDLLTDPANRQAFSAWRDWESGRYHGPLAMVAAGILAASPHNTQPWSFDVLTDRINLHRVPERNLGALDPARREMTLALGCAIENMCVAAPGEGQSVLVTLSPRGTADSCVARLDLRPVPVRAHPLAFQVGQRHTDRRAYLARGIEDRVLMNLAALATEPEARLILFQADSRQGRLFGPATIDATQIIIADTDLASAGKQWVRHAGRDVDRYADGLTLACSGLKPWTRFVGEMLPDQSAESQGEYWLSMTRTTHIPTASAFGLILVRNLYDDKSTLQAGRLWQRLHLQAAALGLAMQPLNQSVEVVDRERQLGKPATMQTRLAAVTGDPMWLPTFGFRMGYGTGLAPASPRRPMFAVIATS